MATRSDLERLCVDVGWRQWIALGVAGPREQQQRSKAVIDPEALILFTAALGDADPRLRDESADWCVSYGQSLVSATRLKNLRRSEPYGNPQIDELISTVNASANTRWHTVSDEPSSLAFEPSGKSRLPALDKNEPLLRLQLRSLFGVTARAEVVLGLLRPPYSTFHFASDFEFAAYSKRNIAIVLDDLARASLVTGRQLRGRLGFRLAKTAELRGLVPSANTAIFARWDLRLRLLSLLVRHARDTERMSAAVRSVEARKLVADQAPILDELDLSAPDVGDPEQYAGDLLSWAIESVVPSNLR